MAFTEKIKDLAGRIAKQADQTKTEEAAKQAFVLPFLAALGYDVFNPSEVVPEYTQDVGTKKGERVDYAILKDGEPIILIECKASAAELTVEHASQLYRYFAARKTPVAILTNGVQYKFYSDLEETNKMDQRPFFEFSFLDLPEAVPAELERFCKDQFNAEVVVSAAVELKYTREIKAIFENQTKAADEDFVKFLAGKVHNGRMTQTRRDQFGKIVSQALFQFVDDQIRERLRLNKPVSAPAPTDAPAPVAASAALETTLEELEVFQIVRAILRQAVDPARIAYRDAQSYFSVLLDDNNRKPLCRFKANEKGKRFGTLDVSRKDVWHDIEKLEEIFGFAELLLASLKGYEAGGVEAGKEG